MEGPWSCMEPACSLDARSRPRALDVLAVAASQDERLSLRLFHEEIAQSRPRPPRSSPTIRAKATRYLLQLRDEAGRKVGSLSQGPNRQPELPVQLADTSPRAPPRRIERAGAPVQFYWTRVQPPFYSSSCGSSFVSMPRMPVVSAWEARAPHPWGRFEARHEPCRQAIGRALPRDGNPGLSPSEMATADAGAGYRVQGRLERVSGGQYVERQLMEHEGVLEISGVSPSER